MEELEGYLSLFDEFDHGFMRASYLFCLDNKELEQYNLMRIAIRQQNVKALNALIDMGYGRTKDSAPECVGCEFDQEVIRIMYDRGFQCCRVNSADETKLQQFMHCRNCARKAAIAVLSLFSDGRSAAVGQNRKDVGRIIGRAIWASRGYFAE